MLENEIEKIQKNNELFANALTLKLVGQKNFIFLLEKGGQTKKDAFLYYNVIYKFLKDYDNKVKSVLNTKK